MAKISAVRAREILDSRGNPTLEVEVVTSSGHRGRASVPSGVSTATQEVVAPRDGDPERFLGRGVREAVACVQSDIAQVLVGRNSDDQPGNDRAMIRADGTEDKSRFGANAILGCSLALARASANRERVSMFRHLGGDQATVLPVPLVSVIAGAAYANNSLDIQEFMIAPIGFARYSEALRAGTEVYHTLGLELSERGRGTAIGDSGGFAPSLDRARDAIEEIMRAIARAGYLAGTQIALALDPAASAFRRDDRYVMANEGHAFSTDELIDYWARIADEYPLIVLEDGLAEDDWPGWASLTRRLGDRIEIVGDDVFATHPRILAAGVAANVGNSVVIKPNQVGTLTETMETIAVAQRAGYGIVISGRSAETTDDFIADLAVATRAGRLKAGAPIGGERVAKYNRLLAIERELGPAAAYAGHEFAR